MDTFDYSNSASRYIFEMGKIMDRYLRKRPFLVITLVYTPAAGTNSAMKDFASKGNWDLSEHITIEDAIYDKHLRSATVIIDIFKRNVIKNRLENKTENDVLNYYLTKYNKEVTEAISIWMRKAGKNPESIEPVKTINVESIEGSEDITDKVVMEDTNESAS